MHANDHLFIALLRRLIEQNDFFGPEDGTYKQIKAIFDSGKVMIEKSVEYGGEDDFKSMVNKIDGLTIESEDG